MPTNVDAELSGYPRHDVGWKCLFTFGHAHRAEFPPIGAQPVVQRPCGHARTGCELLSCHCFHSFVSFVLFVCRLDYLLLAIDGFSLQIKYFV